MPGSAPDFRVQIDDFSLGQNSVAPPHRLLRGQGVLSYDTDPYMPWMLMPRKPFTSPSEGATTLDTATSGLSNFGLHEFYRDSSGTVGKLYTIDANTCDPTTSTTPSLKQITLGSAAPVSIGALPAVNVYITDYYPQMVTVGAASDDPQLVIACGDGVLYRYDGGTLTSITGSPSRVSFVETHKRRLWALSSADTSVPASSAHTLFHSALNTIGDWTATANAGNIPIPNYGSPRTGIKSDGEILYVFYLDKIVAITGDDPISWSVEVVSERVGCVSSESLVRVTSPENIDVVMFAGNDGFYALAGMELQRLSDEIIQPDQQLVRYNTGKTVPTPWIRGVAHRNIVMFSRTQVSGTAGTFEKVEEDPIAVYNIELGGWCMFNPGGDASQITAMESSEYRNRVFCLSFESAQFIEGPPNSPMTDGVPDTTVAQDGVSTKANVPMKWKSPNFIPRTIDTDIFMRKLYIQARNLEGAVKVTPFIDGVSATSFTVDVGSASPTNKVVNAAFYGTYAQGKSVAFQVEVDGSTTAQNLVIDQMVLFVDDLGQGR